MPNSATACTANGKKMHVNLRTSICPNPYPLLLPACHDVPAIHPSTCCHGGTTNGKCGTEGLTTTSVRASEPRIFSMSSLSSSAPGRLKTSLTSTHPSRIFSQCERPRHMRATVMSTGRSTRTMSALGLRRFASCWARCEEEGDQCSACVTGS